jgi:hypothetical protein
MDINGKHLGGIFKSILFYNIDEAEGLLFKEQRGYICDRTIGHPSSVNTTKFYGFILFLLFLSAVTFFYPCSGNFSIIAARNAWVGYSVYLCVMEDRNYATRWMVEGALALKKVCGMDGGREA